MKNQQFGGKKGWGRPVSPEDQPLIHALMQRIYPAVFGHYWQDGGSWYLEHCYGAEALRSDLARPGMDYRLLFLDAAPCGILQVEWGTPMPDNTGKAVYLHRLYLGREAQGTGLAAALVRELTARARRKDYDYVWLEAMARQPQALRFYEKQGFVRGPGYELSFPLMLPAYRRIDRYTLSL